MKGDPTKYPEWYKRFLRGVAQVESSGGVNMMNPSSTATGLYGQRYSEIENLPMLGGMSREAFAADTAMQNRIMEQRFEGELPGVPGLMKNVIDITARYKPQLGEKFTFRPDEIAALTNFIGRQGTMNYLASIRDGKPFTVPGNNKTPEEYLKEYNLGFGKEAEEQPFLGSLLQHFLRWINQDAFDILQRDNRFGGRVKKKKYYNGGMLAKKEYQEGGTVIGEQQQLQDLDVKDLLTYLNQYGQSTFPRVVKDPDLTTNQERLLPYEERRQLEFQQITPPPDPQFRLRGEAAPFRTIGQQKDIIAEQESEGDIMEVLRYLPVTGEVIDTYELAKVAATGEDIYGQEQDPTTFAAMTAAGYVIPNVLEQPLKAAWRAVKKFPAKMPKKEFRELTGPEKDQVRANLTQGHLEVYGDKGYTESLSGARPVNVRQLPSLMAGSKLENAVGKDGMIQVSQIENLINSKDISEAERATLQEIISTDRFKALRDAGGGGKVDYNSFRQLGSDAVSTRGFTEDAAFFVDESKEYAGYGVDRLGLNVRISTSRDMALADDVGLARTNLIRTTDPDLQSTEYGHFGEDVIGHYRTFERPDEQGVLYISELQADPLQARGPAGKKEVSLNIPPAITQADYDLYNRKLRLSEKAKREIAAGISPEQTLKELSEIGGVPDSGVYAIAFKQYDSARIPNKDEIVLNSMDDLIEESTLAIEAFESGYRGGPNAKQANLIKNQDQFLISHILEQEARGADKLRFPTGETTSKIQGYGDIEAQVARSRRDLETEQGALDAMMEELDTVTGEVVPSRLAIRVEAMGLSGLDADKAIDYLGRVRTARNLAHTNPSYRELVEKFDSDALKQAYKEFKDQAAASGQKLNVDAPGFEQAVQARANSIKTDIHTYSTYLERIKSQREHLSRVNASTQATQGIMKGYDDLPKSLKKHGLDATKVTDDAGNTWWEVDIPARLGEGVGEIRAYNKGGQVSDKIRVLKKEGYPQKQAVAIALAMKQEGRL